MGVSVPCGFPRAPALRIELPGAWGCSLTDTAASRWVLAAALAAAGPSERRDHFPWQALRCSRVGERWLLPVRLPHLREEPCLIPVLTLLSSCSPGLPRGPAAEPGLEARRPPPRHLLQGEQLAWATSLQHGQAGCRLRTGPGGHVVILFWGEKGRNGVSERCQSRGGWEH